MCAFSLIVFVKLMLELAVGMNSVETMNPLIKVNHECDRKRFTTETLPFDQ